MTVIVPAPASPPRPTPAQIKRSIFQAEHGIRFIDGMAWLAREYGHCVKRKHIKVVLDGQAGCDQALTIHLPNPRMLIDPDLKSEQVTYVCAVGIHEIAHCLFGTVDKFYEFQPLPNPIGNTNPEPLIDQIRRMSYNVLADIIDEKLLQRHFTGTAHYLGVLNDHAADKYASASTLSIIAKMNPRQLVEFITCVQITRSHLPDPHAGRDSTANTLESLIDNLCSTIDALSRKHNVGVTVTTRMLSVLRQLHQPNHTEPLLPDYSRHPDEWRKLSVTASSMAQAITDWLSEFPDNGGAPNPSPSTGNKSGQAPGPGPGQAPQHPAQSPSPGPSAMPNDPASAQRQSNTASMCKGNPANKKKPGDPGNGAGGPEPVNPPPSEFDDGLYRSIRRSIIRNAKPLLSAPRHRYVTASQSGAMLLDPIRIFTDQRCLARQGPVIDVHAAVATVVDLSGSVHRYIPQLKAIALAFGKGLVECGATAAMWSFGTRVRRVSFQSVPTLRQMGGTNTTEAASDALAWLSNPNFKGRRRILVVITDGYPNDPGSLEQTVNAATRSGVAVIGVAYGSMSTDALEGTMPSAYCISMDHAGSQLRQLATRIGRMSRGTRGFGN